MNRGVATNTNRNNPESVPAIVPVCVMVMLCLSIASNARKILSGYKSAHPDFVKHFSSGKVLASMLIPCFLAGYFRSGFKFLRRFFNGPFFSRSIFGPTSTIGHSPRVGLAIRSFRLLPFLGLAPFKKTLIATNFTGGAMAIPLRLIPKEEREGFNFVAYATSFGKILARHDSYLQYGLCLGRLGAI